MLLFLDLKKKLHKCWKWLPLTQLILVIGGVPLNAPSPNGRFRPLQLYGQPLPTVNEFVYLGMPFKKNGLDGPGILTLRKNGAIKTMALLTSIGVHRNGFSLLLCARLY